MNSSETDAWRHFQEGYKFYPSVKLAIDISAITITNKQRTALAPRFETAFQAMTALESGAISNPDENRRVGHYWLRNPGLAPDAAIRAEIVETLQAVQAFSEEIHSHKIQGAKGPFRNFLLIGIGGSALGPQLAAHALGNTATDRMKPYFFDNTDPDGMERVLNSLRTELGQTLVLVVSKSGSTKETSNGMMEAKSAFDAAKLSFSKHAVAVTGVDSKLDRIAVKEGWIRRFPMWDWVGGRTSETSAVGLLPAALQGFDINTLLQGASAMDELTRRPRVEENPAALLALAWYAVGQGRGQKDMVILPYKDRLELMSRYLQQLVMESLGKELDLSGKKVNQGIAVYGNKGSTDQHAYIQQLRDGLNNFFVTFIEVLKDRSGSDVWVSEGTTSGDYLQGFFLGTRSALRSNGRESITITIDEVSEFSLGGIIALFERAVGLYALLIHINAYHQPGVEAGKIAAEAVLATQRDLFAYLKAHPGAQFTIEELAENLGGISRAETLFKLCQRLVRNPSRGIRSTQAADPFMAKYWFES